VIETGSDALPSHGDDTSGRSGNEDAFEEDLFGIGYLEQPDYLQNVGTRSLEWIRSERVAVTELETTVSYVRRLVQGELDIVMAEQRRRLLGGNHDLASLVQDLPQILATNLRAPGLGPLPRVLTPAALDHRLIERMAEAAPDSVLTRLTEVSDAELASTAERLSLLEHHVSNKRRTCLAVLDRLSAELVDRYRSGESRVDDLLR